MDYWTKESETRLLIDQNFGPIKYLFGIPLLLIGLYFLYQYLIMGIVAFIQVGDWWGLFSSIFGWLVIIAIGLLFLVPGWVIVFLRDTVIIDTSLGHLIKTQDFLIYKRVKQYQVDDFERVRARQARSKASQSSTNASAYVVELTTKDGQSVIVAKDGYEPARKLRGIIADMLGLKKSRKTAKQQVEAEPEEE